MSSIKDALRVIAAEKRIEELGIVIDLHSAVLDQLGKRMTELDEKLDAVAASEARMRQATPSPRPIERR
jgi:uncharacterized coiled-coil protein SlyX